MQNYWLSDVNYQKSFIKRIRESAEKMADGSVDIPAAEKEYAEAMLGIVAKYGKLSDYDGNGIYVGYEPGSENENAKIGVKCGNCYLNESEKVCKIIKEEIEPNGLCRLAAIPDSLVNNTEKPEDDMEDEEEEEEEELDDRLNDRQKKMYETYESIVEEYGIFDQSSKANGAHYAPAAKNPFIGEGMVCGNCVFFIGGGKCEIVSGNIEPNAICKLWIIPEQLIKVRQ